MAEEPREQLNVPQKKMLKQLTGKRDDNPLHTAARGGDLTQVTEILINTEEVELKRLLEKQNQSGETPLYVAVEYGDADVVRQMIQHYDLADAEIKARNGFDPFHIAAKKGDLEVVKVLTEVHPGLAMTVDLSNTTALHTAASQGHIEVVKFLLQSGSSLATIAKSNGKTALHSAARNGHVEVVTALLAAEPGIATRTDKKGQTALHMSVKGQSVEVVEELIKAASCSINMADTKGNSALHIATRKGRTQIVKLILGSNETDKMIINRAGETSLDTAEKTGRLEIAAVLRQHGVQNARTMKHPATTNGARELKQTVSDIKHEVHYQLENTFQTRKHVQGISKQLTKMQTEGLNNAITSTTVVAVLIATVTFAAIFTVPGQYVDDLRDVLPTHSLGEANISPKPAFVIFFLFDSLALFISLAVVVVQTSVVVIESKAKKQLMSIINKLMWLACVLVSVAFLALSFIVVGENEIGLAIGVTAIGTCIMVPTLGTMCFWVIRHRIEAKNARSLRKSSMASGSRSWARSVMSDSEVLNKEYKKMYAI